MNAPDQIASVLLEDDSDVDPKNFVLARPVEWVIEIKGPATDKPAWWCGCRGDWTRWSSAPHNANTFKSREDAEAALATWGLRALVNISAVPRLK